MSNAPAMMRPVSTRRSLSPGRMVCIGALALSALLPVPGADARILHMPSICPFYRLTGLPCPACGLTRAFVCMAHGQFAEAWRYHALGPLLFVCFVAYALFGSAVDAGWERLSRPHRGWITAGAVAVVLAVWAVRLAGWDPLPG
jgi:hypothetical protein